MRSAPTRRHWGWLAATLLACGGCYAPCCCQVPGDCMCSLDECQWGCALDRLCTGQAFQHGPCGDRIVCDAVDCSFPVACEEACPSCPLEHCRLCRPVEHGPPPVTYRPPMPPEFLPVPTRPVFSAVNMTAPEPRRGAVEVTFGTPQLVVPGRD